MHYIKKSEDAKPYKLFECNFKLKEKFCNTKFDCCAKLFLHLRMHIGDKQFNCTECGRTFV